MLRSTVNDEISSAFMGTPHSDVTDILIKTGSNISQPKCEDAIYWHAKDTVETGTHVSPFWAMLHCAFDKEMLRVKGSTPVY
jgi:hypothetical protein